MKELGTPRERGLLLQFVLEDYRLKLLAIALSIGAFAVIRCDRDAQRSMYLDVVTLLPPRGSELILISPLPAKLKVTLRGPPSRLAKLAHHDFAPIQIDLREPGQRLLRFEASTIQVAHPVQVLAVEPARVPLSWRKRAERRVPVRVQVHGSPQRGQVVHDAIWTTPASVVISGPQDELATLRVLYTHEVSVAGWTPGSYQLTAKRKALPGHLSYVEHAHVTLRIAVRPSNR